MDKNNEVIAFSKYLFFNGVINEDGIKNLFEQYIKNSSRNPNLPIVHYLAEYFQIMKKSRRRLVSFSKYTYLKFFEIDDKAVLRTVKRMMIIYSSQKRKKALKLLLRWKYGGLQHLVGHRRNISAASNTESNKTFISKTSVDRRNQRPSDNFNENYLRSLMEMSGKCCLHTHNPSESEAENRHKRPCNHKTPVPKRTDKQELNKSNSKVNMPIYNKNYEHGCVKVRSPRPHPTCLSPKCNHMRNKANLDFKERVQVYSSNKPRDNYESPLKRFKDQVASPTNRHDYLYSLHKQKDTNLKKLQENVYNENGITFKPKLNSKSINKSSSNLTRHVKTDSHPRYDFINTYNTYIETCSPKANKSLSQKNLVRSYETTENNNTNLLTYEYLKTKESANNNNANDVQAVYSQTKESISTVGKTTSEAFGLESAISKGFITKKNSAFTSKKTEIKSKFKQPKRDFLSENESLTQYKSETNSTSNKPEENKYKRVYSSRKQTAEQVVSNEPISERNSARLIPSQQESINIYRRQQNPFTIDTYNEKEILDMANNYITTDESLETYQEQLKKERIEYGIRYNLRQKGSNKNENFSFKNQMSKEKVLHSSSSASNHQVSTANSNKFLQENIQKALKFYNIANK